MIKIAIKNPDVYVFFSKIPGLRRFFSYNYAYLDSIIDSYQYSFVIDQMMNSNGTCKTTWQNRFEELDRIVIDYLKDRKSDRLLIHDLAVSDGITTKELFEKLEQHKFNFQIVASDKYNQVFLKKSEFYTMIRDMDGRLIYLSILGIICEKKLTWKFGFSKILGIFFQRKFENTKTDKNLFLFNPEFARILNSPNVTFEVLDAFNLNNDKKYDFVRVMNLLNISYFSNNKIVTALNGIKAITKDNGLVLIGRTERSGENNATLYIYINQIFQPVHTFGNGSEIHNLITSL